MSALHDHILAECRLIAENTMWNTPTPRGIEDIIDADEREKVAQTYFQEAVKEIAYVQGCGQDPEIVLRAVSYLSIHAIPPQRESTSWFREGLHTLLVLACPFAGVPPGGQPFFEDIRRGMQLAETWEAPDGA
jgi:hypothetical protein